MHDQASQVCHNSPQSKSKLSTAIGAAWGRVSNDLGKGSFADAMGSSVRTIERAQTGPSLPDAEHLLNSLAADQSALDEVVKLYGLKLVQRHVVTVNDMDLVAALSGSVTEYLERIKDGHRCHIDEAVLAKLFRPIIPQMQAIVDSHDARVTSGVRAVG